MEYSIFKDETPQDTVKKIKSILKKYDIELEEKITKRKNDKYAPFSLCLLHKNILRSNGKGSCIENALASAYAEFMERLQHQFIIINGYCYAPDMKKINIKDLKNNVLCSFKDKNLLAGLVSFHLYRLKLRGVSNDTENICLFPFYNVKDKKLDDLPVQLLFNFLQCSNGLAAGNTIEEALVQGLSEICERYAMHNIIHNKIITPDIPQDLYLKYDRIKELIKYCNNNGYEVYIKDASLGKNLPVVLTVFKNKKKNRISFKCGSHLSLPVAVERTITEFCQGFDLSADLKQHIKMSNINISYTQNKEEYIDYRQFFGGLCGFENNNYFDKIFFSKDTDYKFNKNTWMEINEQTTNKTLLKNLYNIITKITKNIWVRDSSFLGFPSVCIVIPEMSFVFEYDLKSIQNADTFVKWLDSPNGAENIDYKTEDLLEFLEYISNKIKIFFISGITERMQRYISLLFSILLNDFVRINKYADLLINENDFYDSISASGLNIVKISKDFYKLKSENKKENEIQKELEKLYQKKEINKFYDFKNNLSLDVIKEIILELGKMTTNDDEHFEKIRQKLYEDYRKNAPNQMNLEEVFNFE